MTEHIAFTRHACLIQKKNISKDPFTSQPLRAVEAVDRSPTLGLVGHIGNFGDAVNDGAAFINIPDSFSGAMQGFQLSISPTLERQIEYRGRLPDGVVDRLATREQLCRIPWKEPKPYRRRSTSERRTSKGIQSSASVPV